MSHNSGVTHQPHPLINWLKPRAQWLLWACGIASLTAYSARELSHTTLAWLPWFLELLAHWQLVYAGAGGIALLAVCATQPGRRRWWALVPAALLAVSWCLHSPQLQHSQTPFTPESTLRVATANLHWQQTDFQPLLQWLIAADAPDVVFLQEFTEAARRALRHTELLARYPHRLEAAQDDPFGLALLSRYPLQEMQILSPSHPQRTLQLRARMVWNGRNVQLSALHPMPPVSASYAHVRDKALREEALFVAQTALPGIVAGDLNNTPWSVGLHSVGHQLQRAHPPIPTWPNAGGFFSLLPLDQVLATPPHWQALSAGWGPHLGSDHRPLVVQMRLLPQ